MTIYKNPYQTPTFGVNFKNSDIINELIKAITADELHNTLDVKSFKSNCSGVINCDKTPEPLCLINDNGYSNNIKSFFAPLIVTNKDSVYIVNDYRQVVSSKRNFNDEFETTIKAGKIPDYNLKKDLQVIGQLTYIDYSLKHLSSLPEKVFSMWLSVSISRRFSLDFNDQHTLNVLFSIWFNSLFYPETKFTGEDLTTLLSKIRSNQSNNQELIKDIEIVLEEGYQLANINDIIELTKKFVVNISYKKDFNLSTLLNLISNTYYGLNGKEMIAMSLEYPGMFIAILYNVVSDRTFKKSVLMNIAERFNKKQDLTNFMTEYTALIK